MNQKQIFTPHEKFLQGISGINKLSGKHVSKYRLETYLGQTNIAHIYSAKKIGEEQTLSVYLFPNQYSDEPGFIDQFLLQSGILRELQHNNINPILDYGIEHKFPFIITQYASALSLNDLIQTAKRRMVRIPLNAGLYIFNTIAKALAYAHNLGVAHGDIQGNNVLLLKNGEVILTDFGYKTFFNKIVLGQAKETGPLITEEYSFLRQQIDQDIFTLGLLFYKTITGQFPYSDKLVTPQWLYQNIHKITLDPLTKYIPELPKEIENGLKTALKQKPEPYHSIEEFISDISHYKEEVKTSILPTAHISDMLSFSSRFSNAGSPNEFKDNKNKKIALFFLDTGQVLELEKGRQYTLGRIYEKSPIIPDIDLTPFKGYEWGISRIHAILDIKENQVFIIDNNSSNGTYQGGKRIPSNIPYRLSHGNIFMLGKLRLQILISDE